MSEYSMEVIDAARELVRVYDNGKAISESAPGLVMTRQIAREQFEAAYSKLLIATAPKSYDALRQYVSATDNEDLAELVNAYESAKLAIAKIGGSD